MVPPTPSLIYLKLKRFKGPKTHHFTFFTFTINLEESYLVPRYRRLTWRSRTSYLAIDDNFCRVVPRTSLSTINFCRVVPRTSISTINFWRVVPRTSLSTINFCRVVHSYLAIEN